MRYLSIFLLAVLTGRSEGKTITNNGHFLQKKQLTQSSAAAMSRPLLFIENKGQIHDQAGHTRTDVQYKVATPGMNVYISAGALRYQFIKANKGVMTGKLNHSKPATNDTLYRMDVLLEGANTNAEVTADEAQTYSEHHTLLQNNHITAHSCTRITYRNIYPHIDWVLHIRDNKLEYDFVVHEGGNVSDIRMTYGGALRLHKGAGNTLVATTPMGNITEQAPYSYEAGSKKKITSRAVLNDNVVTFKTGRHKGSLIIDPTLAWATYYGGLQNEYVADVATDDTNNIFVSGATRSADNIATTGSYETVLQGNYDAFLAKFSSSGTLLWATYYGGSMNDYGSGVACDHSGNVYLVGSTESTTGIATTGAYQGTIGGSVDDFIAKFDGAGTLLWGTYFGNTGNENSYKAACDAAGNILIVGGTTSTTGIATPGSYQIAIGSTSLPDAFLAKFSSTGALQWATYYGGTGNDAAEYVKFDAAGNIYIAGGTSSPNHIATPGAFQTTPTSDNDAFLSKFDATGTHLLWGTYFGGNSYDYIGGLAINNFGDLFIVGKTLSTNLPVTSASYQSTFTGAETNYITRFDTSGTFKWCTYYGDGTSYITTEAADAVCDKAGNVYVTGPTTCNSHIITPDAYFPYPPSGGTEIFLGKFSRSGKLKYGTYYALFNNSSTAICIDTSSNIIIGGYTDATGGIATTGAHQVVYGGGTNDGVIIKFAGDTAVYFAAEFTDTILCPGGSVNIPYGVTKAFNPGNVFTAQLSGPTGSFASPANIGGATATVAGTIAATIPAGTATGSGYRVRIVASSPADTSDAELKNIKVNAVVTPAVSISSSPFFIVPGSSATFTAATTNGGTAPTYQWYRNGLPIAGATTNPYTVPTVDASDVISVVVHSNAPCAVPDSAVSQLSLGVQQHLDPASYSFTIVPNPGDGNLLIVRSAPDATPVDVKVINCVGANIFQQTVSFTNGHAPLKLDQAPSGLYIVELTDSHGNTRVQKITIQR